MFISTFHSNNSTGLWALISGGGGEHSLMTSTRCPTLLTRSLQLIVVTPRRGGGGTGDGLSQREGRCLRPGMLSLSCRRVSYHCGGRSALILYFLAFQNFLIKLLSCFASSHSTIVKLCKKMHISGLRPTVPIGKYEKLKS